MTAQATGVVPPVVDRKVLRDTARWEKRARPVAIEQARRLAMALYHGKAIETKPYQLGLAFWQGEVLWPRRGPGARWTATHGPNPIPRGSRFRAGPSPTAGS